MSITHLPLTTRSRSSHAGNSMIEVLAALFILSVGLLGVAGLQAQGIRAGHSATLRSMAVFKSQEIVEAVRANQVALLAGDYNLGTGLGQQNNCEQGAALAVMCTPAQMAQNDVFIWRTTLGALFPVGVEGGLTTAPASVANSRLLTVTITWRERGTNMNYTSQMQIP
ncbi:MAG: type IV pilus modification protein PilV [Gammaproteobacteria bacterium]|nr:type IV pilus modification protein PilV [Gammaproteobacteria bacterium]